MPASPEILTENRQALEVIEFITRNAEFMADLTISYLKHLGMLASPKKKKAEQLALPPGFLLELGAILQIEFWERVGLGELIDTGLPKSRSSLDDLFARYRLPLPRSKPNSDIPDLALSVFRTSLTRFAWRGREELNVDVLLDDSANNIALNTLADFLWKHRGLGKSEGGEQNGSTN